MLRLNYDNYGSYRNFSYFPIKIMKTFTSSRAALQIIVCVAFVGSLSASAHAVVLPWGEKALARDAETIAPQIQYQNAAPAPMAAVSIVNNAPAASSAPTMESNTGLGFESQLMEEEVSSFQSVSFATASGAVSPSGNSASTLTAIPEMNVLFPIVGLLVAISSTQFLRRRRAAQLSNLDQ